MNWFYALCLLLESTNYWKRYDETFGKAMIVPITDLCSPSSITNMRQHNTRTNTKQQQNPNEWGTRNKKTHFVWLGLAYCFQFIRHLHTHVAQYSVRIFEVLENSKSICIRISLAFFCSFFAVNVRLSILCGMRLSKRFSVDGKCHQYKCVMSVEHIERAVHGIEAMTV